MKSLGPFQVVTNTVRNERIKMKGFVSARKTVLPTNTNIHIFFWFTTHLLGS